VDFRNAPETKQPGAQEDGAEAVRYVYNNAVQYGVDKNRIGVWGFSGGSLVALGAARILSEANQAHYIKALFL